MPRSVLRSVGWFVRHYSFQTAQENLHAPIGKLIRRGGGEKEEWGKGKDKIRENMLI